MKNIAYIALMVSGVALALQPVFAQLASFNGATVGGILLLVAGARLFHMNNTTEYNSTS